MENKRRIRNHFLTFTWCALGILSCMRKEEETISDIKLVIADEEPLSKTAEPDEDKMKDIHIYIFSTEGELEYRCDTNTDELEKNEEGWKLQVQLINGRSYNLYACANLGFDPDISNIEDINGLRCYLAYPDDYREGIPMSCRMDGIMIDRTDRLFLNFRRIMSRISIRIDRSHLDEDVRLLVRNVRVGNCPKNALVFNRNGVENRDELFANGFIRGEEECEVLNTNTGKGLSGSLSLYMLENCQGRIENVSGTAAGKIFPASDGRSQTASYIEIGLDYLSSRYFTEEKELKYRFWLGEDHRDINVERNCHYQIRICPENDGLGAEGWRIDKSGLREVYEKPSFKIMPSRYLSGRVGEDLHVWCEFNPSYAPFDIGKEELDNDKARGVYDYTIDPDGKGVVLHLKKRGQGILYMEAGPPVNCSDMAYIEIYP